jgi:hypothetical protein
LERNCSKQLAVSEAALPLFNFDSINTWEGAYQGVWLDKQADPVCELANLT